MASIQDIADQASELRFSIRSLLRKSGYEADGDLSRLEADRQDSNQLFLLDELYCVIEKLADVEAVLHQLSLPVLGYSRLHQNGDGRYETDEGQVYTCGSPMEALISDDRREVPYWARTRVEHDGGRYYLVGYRNVPLDGLIVRTRREM